MKSTILEKSRMQGLSRTAVIVFLALNLSASNQAAAQTPEDESAIRQAIETMTTAFNTRNDEMTASVMTSDAEFVTVTGHWSKGVTDYIASRHERFATALKNASIRISDVKIRFLRADVALAYVAHEITGMLDSAGKELPPHKELSLRVFIKERGKWLMTAFHNTSVAVPATAQPK